MLTVASFIVVKNWKQCKCISTGNWINKMQQYKGTNSLCMLQHQWISTRKHYAKWRKPDIKDIWVHLHETSRQGKRMEAEGLVVTWGWKTSEERLQIDTRDLFRPCKYSEIQLWWQLPNSVNLLKSPKWVNFICKIHLNKRFKRRKITIIRYNLCKILLLIREVQCCLLGPAWPSGSIT